MRSNFPPTLPERLLRPLLKEELLEEILGDLFEYYQEISHLPKWKRNIFYWFQLINFLRPFAIKSIEGTHKLNTFGMLKHNLTIIFRNFRKYKNSFAINLLGLTAGLTSFLLIFLWVNDEWQKDKFHESGEGIYQVLRTLRAEGQKTRTFESNSVLLAPSLREEIPEVKMAVPIARRFPTAVLSLDEKQIKSEGQFAGKDLFNLFSFNLIQGDKETALDNQESIVISKRIADYFFPESNPIGKSLHLVDNSWGMVLFEADYVITGVFDNSSLNTSMDHDFYLSYTRYLADRDQSEQAWFSNSPRVYIQLDKALDKVAFAEKLDEFYQAKTLPLNKDKNSVAKYQMHIQPYATRYLHNKYENGVLAGGRITYVYLFSVIGLLILLIACINFINLSTAVAARRAKEIGVKKVFGVHRRIIAIQYLTESLVIVSMAALLSTMFLALLLPSFNEITGKALTLGFNPTLFGSVLGIILFTSLLAGSYPATFLSQLTPLDAFSGKLKSSVSEVLIRKGLIVFQFGISILMIISVITITRQMDYVQSKNLGYDKENVISIPREGSLVENIAPFMTEIGRIPGVVNSTLHQGSIARFSNSASSYKRPGKPYIEFTFARVGYNYVETLNLELKGGRSFSPDFANENATIILNETAIKAMELEDPIGKVVNIRGEREVIGILKDYHYRSLHDKIEPMFLIFMPEEANAIGVKLAAGRERETLKHLEQVYRTFNPGMPFEFRFLDDEYQALYAAEERVAHLSQYFAVIAIFISCLGLFGLTAFMTERRLKEIGIRKVLGSSRIEIVSLLGSNMLKLLFIAILIALPISYILLGRWLENFAYRIDLSLWMFVLGALAALLIATLTVSIQTWRAASVNPVYCLKDE